MKLAVMQPYIFPYIGYYQLINAADRFVVYDDVTFIKQGWINRNRILLNGTAYTFTVPLQDASSYIKIAHTEISERNYGTWRDKFLKTLAQAYAKAPHYKTVSELVSAVLHTKCATISELATESLLATSRHIGIDTEFSLTALHYSNDHLKAQERVIDICRQEKADMYINLAGGIELYSQADFAKEHILLQFIRSGVIHYPQPVREFVPALSIIDVLMWNQPEDVMKLVQNYTLE